MMRSLLPKKNEAGELHDHDGVRMGFKRDAAFVRKHPAAVVMAARNEPHPFHPPIFEDKKNQGRQQPGDDACRKARRNADREDKQNDAVFTPS
jgi:hypothetical protein